MLDNKDHLDPIKRKLIKDLSKKINNKILE
jgi:hypothetical protein